MHAQLLNLFRLPLMHICSECVVLYENKMSLEDHIHSKDIQLEILKINRDIIIAKDKLDSYKSKIFKTRLKIYTAYQEMEEPQKNLLNLIENMNMEETLNLLTTLKNINSHLENEIEEMIEY